MSASFDRRFYLVWHDPHLRHRIFYHRRPPATRDSACVACALHYVAALLYAPAKMRYTPHTLTWAAERGHLGLVKWLLRHGKEGPKSKHSFSVLFLPWKRIKPPLPPQKHPITR